MAKTKRFQQSWISLILTMFCLYSFIGASGCGDDDDDDDDNVRFGIEIIRWDPPAGSTLPNNAPVTLTFNAAPGDVTINGTPAVVIGRTAIWTSKLPLGPVTLRITWKEAGSDSIPYTVIEPNE